MNVDDVLAVDTSVVYFVVKEALHFEMSPYADDAWVTDSQSMRVKLRAAVAAPLPEKSLRKVTLGNPLTVTATGDEMEATATTAAVTRGSAPTRSNAVPLPVGGSVTYDWGDGTPSTTIPVEDAVDVHLYDRPGTYRVVSTVTDSSGKFYGSGSTTFKADHGALVVTSVTPDNGPAAGGTAVVLAGEGFTGLGKVRFEPNEAVFTVVSDSQVDATTPPGTGTVDILVWRQTDGKKLLLYDSYTYGVMRPLPSCSRSCPRRPASWPPSPSTSTGRLYDRLPALVDGSEAHYVHQRSHAHGSVPGRRLRHHVQLRCRAAPPGRCPMSRPSQVTESSPRHRGTVGGRLRRAGRCPRPPVAGAVMARPEFKVRSVTIATRPVIGGEGGPKDPCPARESHPPSTSRLPRPCVT